MQSLSAQSHIQFDQQPGPQVIAAIKSLYDDFRDPEQFIENSLMIQTRRGQLVPFKLKNKQREFIQRIKDKREAGRPVRMLIPKTRRVGMSAVIAASIFEETPFFEGQSALILAHEKKAARNLFNYYHRFEQNYKRFRGIGLPLVAGRSTSQDSGSIRWVNRSQIEIATAGNLDFSRSFDFRFLHLSEYAYYPNIRGLMTALIATVADDPGTMIFKESTANAYNDFYRDCTLAMEGESDYEVFFVGCFDDEENWRDLARDHVDPLKFERSLDDQEWALIERYSLVLEQIYWRRMKLKDYGNDLTRFDQEYPHSFEVAFQASGRQRFAPELFTWMPTQVPYLRGELRKEEINRKEELIFRPHQYGTLKMWQRPRLHGQYVGGVDVAKGVDINKGIGTPDPDYCVAEVGERSNGEQVAELHTRLKPIPFANYLYDLGKFYNWVYWVIEVEFSGGNGSAVITELIRLGYPLERIYFDKVLDKASKKQTDEPGFIIRPHNRNNLIANHERYLIQRSLILHSAVAVAEHNTFVEKASGKVEHEDQMHDDLVFGCMYLSWALDNAPDLRPLDTGRTTLPSKYGQGELTEREKQRLINEMRKRNSIINSRKQG